MLLYSGALWIGWLLPANVTRLARRPRIQGARALVVCLIALSATAGCSSSTPTAPGPPAGDQPPPSSNPAPPPPADPSAPPNSPPPPADPSPPPDSPSPSPNQAPLITSHPRSQTIKAGTGVTLTVKATGPGSLAYQWFAGSSGQTSSRIAGASDDKYHDASADEDDALLGAGVQRRRFLRLGHGHHFR